MTIETRKYYPYKKIPIRAFPDCSKILATLLAIQKFLLKYFPWITNGLVYSKVSIHLRT